MGNGSQSPEMWKVCNFWFVVMELACECSRPGCSNTMHSSDSNTLLHERDHAQRPNYSLHQTSAPGTICTCTQEWSMTYWQQAKCDLTCPNPLTKSAVACLGSTQTTQTAWGPCGTWFLLGPMISPFTVNIKTGLHFILRCPCYSVFIHLSTG